MKAIIWILALVLLAAGPAFAGRNAGGAMVLHTNDAVIYSPGADYCAQNPLPPACEALVTQINKSPDVEAIIWVVAAFPCCSSPGVTAFQVGVYGDVPFDYFSAFAPCGPGALEIPDETWPAPGTGTAVAFTAPVYPAEPIKLYWFATAGQTGWTFRTGEYPHGDMHAEFADDQYPPQIDICSSFGSVAWGRPGLNQCPDCNYLGACCFNDGHCELLSQNFCNGVFMGVCTTCDPSPCGEVEACCSADGLCDVVSPDFCRQAGGTPQGPGTDCDPNPCITHYEACCFPDGHCENTIFDDGQCAQAGGIGQGIDTSCSTTPCPPAEACCFADNHCEMLTADACTTAGGTPQGEGTICESIQCVPTPTKMTTWGAIKGTYR